MHYGMTSLFRFRFCSHNQMSTSAKLDHMKNTVKHGNGYRYGFHRLSQLIVQNKSSISTRKVFSSGSTTQTRSLEEEQRRIIVLTTHHSLDWEIIHFIVVSVLLAPIVEGFVIHPIYGQMNTSTG